MSACGSATGIGPNGVQAGNQFANQVGHPLRVETRVLLSVALLPMGQLRQRLGRPHQVGVAAALFGADQPFRPAARGAQTPNSAYSSSVSSISRYSPWSRGAAFVAVVTSPEGVSGASSRNAHTASGTCGHGAGSAQSHLV